MNVICLVVDRLHLGHLGAYGNSWISTPAVDRFAAEAFTFDQALLDGPSLEVLYRSYWQGLHAMCRPASADSHPSLPALLRNADFSTALLTDERLLVKHPSAVEFDELIEIDPPWQPQTASQVEETHLAQCFVRAVEWIGEADHPFFLWCHLAGLGTTWDAPMEFRRAYWEEGDPEPPESADVPELTLDENYDPDRLLGITQSYAGQVSLWDTCFGALVDFLDDSDVGRETLVVLTSSRGFPLGEHRRVGPCSEASGGEALYGELVHVPLMLRFPDRFQAAARSAALVEPSDLWATLADCCGLADLPPTPTAHNLMPLIREEVETVRDRICIAGAGAERAIRTPAWYLRTGDVPELFAKPDDRWEVNNVADRCHDVVDDLQRTVTEYEQAIDDDRLAELPPLDDVLLEGLD